MPPNLSQLQYQQLIYLLDKVDLSKREIAKQYIVALKSIRSDLMELSDKEGKLSLSEATKYNRLIELDKSITQNLNDLLQSNIESVDKILVNSYESLYYRYGWAVNQHLQVDLSWGLLTKETVESAIANPYKYVSWNKYRGYIFKKVKDTINQGIIQGESVQQLTKRLQPIFDIGYRNVEKIVRTETHRIMETASQDQFEYAKDELKIDLRKRLVSVLDDRTRPQSAQMDGDISDQEGRFLYPNGIWAYPGNTGVPRYDINDRERSVEYIEDAGPIVRRTREDGVIPYQNFEDWAKEKNLTHNIYGEKLF